MPFLGNWCIEKFSNLPVSLENKQSAIVPYASLQWGFNLSKYWLLLLAKAQEDLSLHDL